MKVKDNVDIERLKAIANQKKSIYPPSPGKNKFIHNDDKYNLKVKNGNAKIKKNVTNKLIGKKSNVATEEEYKRIALKEIELMTRMAEYKNANKIEFFDTPNPKQALILDGWKKEMYKVFCFTGGNRSGKCATVNTLIETTQGKKTIGELYEKSKPFEVYAWDGNKKVVTYANPPIKKKGLHKCYNLNMSNGETLGLADHHRVLTSHGWLYVEQLQASFDNLQGCSLVNDHGILHTNEHHLKDKYEGCLDDYLHDYRQDGEQLPSLLDNDRSFSPLQDDVQQHNDFLYNLDDQHYKHTNNPYVDADHPSNQDVLPLFSAPIYESLSYSFCKFLRYVGLNNLFAQQSIYASSLGSLSNPVFAQPGRLSQEHPFWALYSSLCSKLASLRYNNRKIKLPSLKFFVRFLSNFLSRLRSKVPFSCDLSSPFNVIGYHTINSITPIDALQEVYDFEVPFYKNYFAGGIVHHNTTLGTILAISTMLGFYPWNKESLYFPHNLPRKVRYIGQDWNKQIKSVIIPELFKWMPANRKVTRKKNNDGIEYLWTDEETGSSIEVMSNLQDSGLHEGWSGDLIVYDEPPKRPIRIANARGLVDRCGRELFCMTLLKEAWVDREVIKAVDENGRPDMSVFNVHVESFENVGFGITKEGLDQFSKALTPEERKIRLNGVPAYMDGLVYPQYDRKIHLVERFQIPLDWIVDIAIDIHPRTEQAILFCAVSPTGIKYLINEIWEHGDGKWVGEQIVRCIKQNNYRVGRIIIDPLAKGDSNNPNTVFEKVSLVLAQYGFYLETATKDKTAGILEIKNHLKGANNTPSLFIFDDLVRTIFEIEGYVYDKETQKPIDKDDHMCENLYRIMLLDTHYSDLDLLDGLEDQKNSFFSNNGRDSIGGY